MSQADGNETPRRRYGESCEACVHAKAKCITAADSDACQRCTRIAKECHRIVSQRASKRQRREQTPPPSTVDLATDTALRTTRLESRLEELIAQLGNRSAVNPPTPATERSAAWSHVPGSHALQSPAESASSPEADILAASRLTDDEINSSYARFRKHYLCFFPVVHLPDRSSAADLYLQGRPMLWLAIMCIAAETPSTRRRLNLLFRERLAVAIVIHSEKSVDLLLGVLVFVGWYHTHALEKTGFKKVSLSALLGLANSLIHDWWPAAHPYQLFTAFFDTVAKKTANCIHLLPSEARSLEEGRAALGCYLMTSAVFLYIGKGEPPRWNDNYQACLIALEQRPEWRGDRILASQVRMQLVYSQAILQQWYDTSLVPSEASWPRVNIQVAPLLQSLRAVRDGMSSDVVDDESTKSLYHSLRLALSGIGLFPLAENRFDSSKNARQRQQALDCVDAILCWSRTLLDGDAGAIIGHDLRMRNQIIQMLGSLYDVSTFREPGNLRWEIKAEIAGEKLAGEFLAKFEAAAEAHGIAEDDILITIAHVFRSFRLWWESQSRQDGLAGGEHGASGGATAQDQMQAGPPGMEDGMGPLPFAPGLLDDEWLWSMFGDFSHAPS